MMCGVFKKLYGTLFSPRKVVMGDWRKLDMADWRRVNMGDCWSANLFAKKFQHGKVSILESIQNLGAMGRLTWNLLFLSKVPIRFLFVQCYTLLV